MSDEKIPTPGTEARYLTTAEALLEKFKTEMLEKLKRRAVKHPDDNFLSLSVEELMNYDLRPIMDHMNQEIEELYVARAFPDPKKGHTPRKECIDLANLALIEWAIRWARGEE